METGVKRKAEADVSSSVRGDKRSKNKKHWRKHDHQGASQATSIQPGDSGIWATCLKGREGRCIGEMRDLLSEYTTLLYHDSLPNGSREQSNVTGNIENEIMAEIADIRQPGSQQLFTPVKLDVQCVVFFRCIPPIEPVGLVQRICEDARQGKQPIRTRFVQRLTPMSSMGRASADGLEKLAKDVLAPHFHCEPAQPRKYAIRPNLRNHNTLTRDSTIRLIAATVGPGHSVDLKNYDVLILVEIYQNTCGISVVGSDFDSLKRFNIAELARLDQDPPPKDGASPNLKQAAGSTA